MRLHWLMCAQQSPGLNCVLDDAQPTYITVLQHWMYDIRIEFAVTLYLSGHKLNPIIFAS